MNDKRQQILERLKLRKIKEIHSYFDKDNDGFLNHEELSSLQHVTSGQTISRRKYKAVCNMFDCKPAQGLTFRALVLTYDSNGEADVDRDFDRVFGITRDSATEGANIIKTHEEKKEECIATKSKDHKEDPRASLVPVEKESVNLIDLLIAGEDPHIKPSTDGCTDGLDMTDVNMKQIPSKHTFQDITGSITGHTLGESGANNMTNIENGTKTEQQKVNKLVSEVRGRKTSIPKIVKVESKDAFDDKSSNLASIKMGSTEGWANDVESKDKAMKSSLLGMEGTAYTDLHKRVKNTDDECSCLCTIA